MAKKIIKSDKAYFICPECNFAYKEKENAAKCEDWCKKHHSCNIKITRNAVQL